MTALERAAATALRQIAKYGERCTWVSAAAPTIADTAKPWIKEDAAPATTPVSILFTSGSRTPAAQLLAGSPTEASGITAIMGASVATPSLSDVVTRSNGTKLSLESIDVVAPNAVPILYKLVFKA